MKPFTLEIITQEKPLLSTTVTSLSVNTESGEITVLADHIPLFSRLVEGELKYTDGDKPVLFALTGGFIDISPENKVTILADSAIRSDEINLAKVEEAIENAKKALENAPDQKTSLQIELELRHAVLQAKVARKSNQITS